MVLTTNDLEDGFAAQNASIMVMLDESIAAIGIEIINQLKKENENLNKKIETLNSKLLKLEKTVESNLQYQRSSNVIVSGIRASIEHKDLGGILLTSFNSVCKHNISSRDVVACHRQAIKTPLLC